MPSIEHHSTSGSELVQQKNADVEIGASTTQTPEIHDPEKHLEQMGISEGRNVALGKVEAFNKVLNQSGQSGKVLRGIIVVSIGLTMFAYALGQGISPQFDVMATSSFGKHAHIGTVNMASQIIDAYLVVLLAYAVGFAIAASCTNLAAYVVGSCFTSFGERGFWSGMLLSPFLVSTFIDGFISDSFIPEKGRWGLGMFAIILAWQARAVDKRDWDVSGFAHQAWDAIVEIDLAGLILLVFAFSLTLLPFILAKSAQQGWSNHSMIGARVGSQASVPHQDMASVIAAFSLSSFLGGSVGDAIASCIWIEKMLDYMREEGPPPPFAETSDTTLKEIYGSIKILRSDYDWTDPIREGAIRAYTRTNGIIVITATVLAALPVLFSLCMPNYYLGKQQNAVTNTGLDGQVVGVPDCTHSNEDKPGLWNTIKRACYK